MGTEESTAAEGCAPETARLELPAARDGEDTAAAAVRDDGEDVSEAAEDDEEDEVDEEVDVVDEDVELSVVVVLFAAAEVDDLSLTHLSPNMSPTYTRGGAHFTTPITE